MPWLTSRQQQCKCPKPESPFHSDVPLTADSLWQCHICQRVWHVSNSYRNEFQEHKLGENDYWYYADFRPGY